MMQQPSNQHPLWQLSGHYLFPPPENSDAHGLLAYGGDLNPARLIAAYRQGIFPWFSENDPILWWSPDPRLLLFPHEFKLTRSLKQRFKQPWDIRCDTDFAAVIHACATANNRLNNTWITANMQKAYYQLHEQGFAHSLEVWHNKQLIGGFYGISLGHAFFGESMFSKVRDTSKLALYFFCRVLEDWQFDFIDCQLPNPHLQRLGATIIARSEFLERLQQSLNFPTRIGMWTEDFEKTMNRL